MQLNWHYWKMFYCISECKSLSRVQLWNPPGQNTGVDSHSLFQGTFPTQGSNPGLPHCRRILYQLSHQESLICCIRYNKLKPYGRQNVLDNQRRFYSAFCTREKGSLMRNILKKQKGVWDFTEADKQESHEAGLWGGPVYKHRVVLHSQLTPGTLEGQKFLNHHCSPGAQISNKIQYGYSLKCQRQS